MKVASTGASIASPVWSIASSVTSTWYSVPGSSGAPGTNSAIQGWRTSTLTLTRLPPATQSHPDRQRRGVHRFTEDHDWPDAQRDVGAAPGRADAHHHRRRHSDPGVHLGDHSIAVDGLPGEQVAGAAGTGRGSNPPSTTGTVSAAAPPIVMFWIRTLTEFESVPGGKETSALAATALATPSSPGSEMTSAASAS